MLEGTQSDFGYLEERVETGIHVVPEYVCRHINTNIYFSFMQEQLRRRIQLETKAQSWRLADSGQRKNNGKQR